MPPELYINPGSARLLSLPISGAAASSVFLVRRGGRKLLEFSKSDGQDIMKREGAARAPVWVDEFARAGRINARARAWPAGFFARRKGAGVRAGVRAA